MGVYRHSSLLRIPRKVRYFSTATDLQSIDSRFDNNLKQHKQRGCHSTKCAEIIPFEPDADTAAEGIVFHPGHRVRFSRKQDHTHSQHRNDTRISYHHAEIHPCAINSWLRFIRRRWNQADIKTMSAIGVYADDGNYGNYRTELPE